MKEKLKNIFNLSKIYIRENESKIRIIDWESKQINKRSVFFWLYIVLLVALMYISVEAVDYFKKIGKPEIFLNGYFLFIEMLIIMKTIILSTNVFYFSKDIENILHLPFKPIEILISKLATIVFINYETELLFAFIPLLIYGNAIGNVLEFGVKLIIILLLFPILMTTLISMIMTLLMKTIKIFKNKDIMQIVISFLLIFVIIFFVNNSTNFIFENMEYIEQNQHEVLNGINNKIIQVNNYFLNINPSVNILQNRNVFLNILLLIFINGIAIVAFIFIGNKLYLKQLLKANFYHKKKRKFNLNGKARKNSVWIAFLKKDFKNILKNPIFFMQFVYPIAVTTFMVCSLISSLTVEFFKLMEQEEFRKQAEGLQFEIQAVCLIIGTVQVVGLFNYLSITAFSREGKNAFVMKYLPISFYKQFIYKNIPQVFLNILCSVAIFVTIENNIPAIGMNYIWIMFGISCLLFLINSYILTLIDLLMPKLEWDAEYEILKKNKNKLLQYILIVLNILFLVFVNKAFENHNLDKSLFVLFSALAFVFVIFNVAIFKLKNKLFKNIT